MAGTLIVQNIQGPTSGANANKIIVPSGQTLDVSGGTLVPSAGQVVQVVSATKNEATDGQTTSTSYLNTGLQATITPTSANSKIQIIAHFNGLSGSGTWMVSTLFRDSTNLAGTENFGISQTTSWTTTTLTFLDSPSSTSALTYSLHVKSGTTGNIYYHWSGAIDSITLMEIAQ